MSSSTGRSIDVETTTTIEEFVVDTLGRHGEWHLSGPTWHSLEAAREAGQKWTEWGSEVRFVKRRVTITPWQQA
jgi:hypothetical protein